MSSPTRRSRIQLCGRNQSGLQLRQIQLSRRNTPLELVATHVININECEIQAVGSTAATDTTSPTRPDDAIALAYAAFAADGCGDLRHYLFHRSFHWMPGLSGSKFAWAALLHQTPARPGQTVAFFGTRRATTPQTNASTISSLAHCAAALTPLNSGAVGQWLASVYDALKRAPLAQPASVFLLSFMGRPH